eukprot:SAG11_NODE_23214_length_393_cov_0.554422_1_plen_41_part_10
MLCAETNSLYDPDAASLPVIGQIDWNWLTGYGAISELNDAT